MIEIERKELCCGCSACVQRCPKHCISLSEDEEGFFYPIVNKGICINCSLCEKVCPVLHQGKPKNPQVAYAAMNPNEHIRMNSSSGGIFTMLAEHVINDHGVVYGASFDSEWYVRHEAIKSMEELGKLRGSKYVQSGIGQTYLQAEKSLKNGSHVLFSGTPCQIAGLKSFLKRDYANLLTVDFICHGVPSPGVWKWYVDKQIAAFKAAHGGSTVLNSSLNISSLLKDVKFRDKTDGWRKYRFVLTFAEASAEGKKSSVLSSLKDDDGYMVAFLNDICLRPSCYNCPFKSGKSSSDITIADFWGISKFDIGMDDDKGTSLVLVNSKQGELALNCVHAKMSKVDVKTALQSNQSWNVAAKKHELHDKFFKKYRKHHSDFERFVNDLVHTKSLSKRVLRKLFRMIGLTQLPV